MYKGGGNKGNCRNYKRIGFLNVLTKIYTGILVEKMHQVTVGLTIEECGASRNCRICVYQTFILKQMCDKMLTIFWVY